MATILSIIDSKGSEVKKLDLDATWLEREKGEQAVHDSVVAFLATIRAGTACTKTRGKVRGGGAKPYRQKGTGRARAGSIRSPLWRGGGTVFGPMPRSYERRVNRKVQRLALRRAFTQRVDDNEVIIVDDIAVELPKTKQMEAFLKGIGAGNDVLMIVDEISPDVYLSARNLPGVEVMGAGTVNTYWMLLFKKVVISAAGLVVLGQRLASQEKAK